MKLGLTPRQLDLLEYLRDYIANEGHPPSYEQMGAFLGVSKSYAHVLVKALEERGHITKKQHSPRSIVIGGAERFSPYTEASIADYCRRHRTGREAAIARAVEYFFGCAP